MFLYRKNPSEEQQLMEQMKENNYRLKIVDLEAQISQLQLQLAVKDCLVKAHELKEMTHELREVTSGWRN